MRSAGQFAMSRAVDITDLSKVLDTASIKVEGRDFLRAIAETTPAFGAQVRVCFGYFSISIYYDWIIHTLYPYDYNPDVFLLQF